jgi:hypothetical protein
VNQNGINKYREFRFGGMPSLDLVIAMLDFCISAASARDATRTIKGLTTLEETLSFRDCPELARVFCRVYERCRHLVWEEKFEQAENCLRLLHDAWSEARRRRKPSL